ncbi:hypothetical protein KNP414_04376 [Paenibacillus mucilaginosus KNP414]|uniref:Uncharacterized protein n=1 Tax=Paenibacillus mucilaginosus (strain KNP414) TaxID=1036673 RepID=F8F6F4_PAEMK|nr:hypothetical protein KNP414_04376 [Paenibacillus mucilaginosus KNP414]
MGKSRSQKRWSSCRGKLLPDRFIIVCRAFVWTLLVGY